MGFGKRVHPPGKAMQATGAAVASAPVAPPVTGSTAIAVEQRLEDLRQDCLRFLSLSGAIATAIRENGSIAMRGMDEEIDPLGPPLTVRGFREHFTTVTNGERVHSVFVYCEAPALGALDPRAQAHLQGLLASIMDLNRYCQQAVKDDALAVALQSPKLPLQVDRIIAGSAFFAGFFERVALARPSFSAVPMRALTRADMARMAESGERHRLMAIDVMLAPEMFAQLVPMPGAPVGIETTWKAHAGEKILNEVYFPASGAQPQAA